MSGTYLSRFRLLVGCTLAAMVVGVTGGTAFGDDDGLVLNVSGFSRDAGERTVWREIDWDPAGERGLALSRRLTARERDADGELGERYRAELLPPAHGEAGRAALIVRINDETERGQTRRFVIDEAGDDQSGLEDAMRVTREDGRLRIANRWYELTHDTQRGGMIESVVYTASEAALPVTMRDGARGHALTNDEEPEIHVRGGDGSLGVVVEVRARLAPSGGPREDGPRVIYRYRYEAGSPLVRIAAEVPRQPTRRRHTNLRLLDLEFDADEMFEQSTELITASSGPGKGELIPREVSIGGDHRPQAGTLWQNERDALATIKPGRGDDVGHEWMGQRQSLSATYYFGPQESAADELALGTRVRATASVPRWRERIEAGLDVAARLNGGEAAVGRTLLHAARQRVERVVDVEAIEHLLDEAEAVIAGASGDASSEGTAHHRSDRFIVIANAHTGLLFQVDGPMLWLDGLYREDHGFIRPANFPRTLWYAWFIDDESGDRVQAISTRADETSLEVHSLEEGGRALIWDSTVTAGEGEVTARGRVALGDDEALASWDIDVQPIETEQGQRLGLWELAYPIVGGVTSELRNITVDYVTNTGYLARVPNPILAGFHEGYERHRIYRRGQYQGYYHDGVGLYIGAHDPDLAPVGTLTRNTGRDGLEFSYLHPTESMGQPGTGHRTADRLVVGTFEGHWYHAAQLYRAWLEQQAWFPSEPLHANPDVPEWAKQAVVSQRGAGEAVIERHRELGEPPSLTWYYHGWQAREPETQEGHPSPKFAGTPDYPVPDGFDRTVELTQREGVRVGAYTLNTWWDYTAASWKEEGVEDAIVHLMGYDRPMYHARRGVGIVCQATELWRDKQGRVASELAQTGVDGTYLDLGGGARLPFLCFADNHGHPPGGGGFMAKGKRAALESFRESAREHNEDFILISEGSAGYFLTVKDGFIEFVKTTPVAAALWFDYLRPLGNKRIIMSDGTHPLSSDPHNAVTPAKHFAWGSSLGRFRGGEWHRRSWSRGVSQLETLPEDLAYYRNLVWHKYVARPWLNLGRMLEPLEIRGVDPAPPAELFEDTFVPSAVWEAPDGRIALVFANGYHDRSISFRYTFDPADYGIEPDGSMALHRLTPAGEPPDVEPSYEFVEVIEGRVQRSEGLGAGDVLILVAMEAPDEPEEAEDQNAAESELPEPDLDALEL